MKKHNIYMEKALEIAKKGISKNQTPFGACIVLNNKIIACEHNIVWKKCDITAHAEITAIRVACKKLQTISLKKATIYSTCEPCPMCFSAIHWAGIKSIVYGADINDAIKYGFNELQIGNEQMMKKGKINLSILGGIERDKAIELFESWYLKRKSNTY